MAAQVRSQPLPLHQSHQTPRCAPSSSGIGGRLDARGHRIWARGLKVLYLQDHTGIGGAQLSLLDLLKALRAIGSGVDPHVVVGGEGFLWDQLAAHRISAEIIRFPDYRKAKDFWQRPKFTQHLASLCRQRRIDLVHANTSQVAPWSARLRRNLGLASCVTVREIIDAGPTRKYRVLENDPIVAIPKAVPQTLPASAKVHQPSNRIGGPD